MILLNFAHPLTARQLSSIADLLDDGNIVIRNITTQFDLGQPFVPQVVALADACSLTADEWQTKTILVNVPSLGTIAAALVAELHGRMGYFPPILVLRPSEGARPAYDVSQIINLNQLRGEARTRRITPT